MFVAHAKLTGHGCQEFLDLERTPPHQKDIDEQPTSTPMRATTLAVILKAPHV